jgi:CRISPR/Cas system CMR subunit Cmr6 (Cas7 group RAMP superfamily)
MKKFAVVIETTSPLLMFNSPGKDKEKEMEGRPVEEIAEVHCYRNPITKEIYAPSRWLKGCIRDYLISVAGKGLKQKTEKEASAFILIEPLECRSSKQDYEINTSVVLVKKNGKICNMVFCTRPLFRPPWEIEFQISVDLGKKSEEYKKVIDEAGRFQGIGSNTKNGYGRFRVKEFREIK